MVERIIGQLLQPYLERMLACGPNQCAYGKGIGSKDALALNVLRWLAAFQNGSRIGLYCSDVAGAFDRIAVQRLLQKIATKGVDQQIIAVLESWLGDRKSYVVVDGISSTAITLRISVFQGTVWGPPLWNCHYEDARRAVNDAGFEETVFADDLNWFRKFDSVPDDATVLGDLQKCQHTVHAWGQPCQPS